ncbi:WD40-repeat-containing domain protein [Chytridium lagenaria]|nr:WD40-repeat-containing domain protein [Chytridium lagenaria]
MDAIPGWKNEDLECPICLDIINEAFMTKCGHSFCFVCISSHLDLSKSCPVCQSSLDVDQIYPNYLLNKFIAKCKALGNKTKKAWIPTTGAGDSSKRTSSNMEAAEIDEMLTELLRKKNALAEREELHDLSLLHAFLKKAKTEKSKMLDHLTRVLSSIESDLSHTEKKLASGKRLNELPRMRKRPFAEVLNADLQYDLESSKMLRHFEDLEQGYLGWRLKEKDVCPSSLSSFSHSLSRMSKFSSFRTVAKIYQADRLLTGSASSIISSMDFDRDDEFFATAGVTRKIKIYDFATVISDYRDERGRGSSAQGFITARQLERSRNPLESEDAVVDEGKELENDDTYLDNVPRYPIIEMGSRAKISCVSWNPYIKSQMLSTDYDGAVTLWDATRGVSIHTFEEHEKRACGGDDAKGRSILSLDTKANVCSVKWNPKKPSSPLMVFTGHRKAVSYVEFISKRELVSASTDCTLRLWDLNFLSPQDSLASDKSSPHCTRTYSGHVNEKKTFVYTYYSRLSQPVIGGQVPMDDPSQFVSSVC